jgi:hypothetical protein
MGGRPDDANHRRSDSARSHLICRPCATWSAESLRLLSTKEDSRRAVRPHRNGPRDSGTLSHVIPYSSIIWPFFGQDCWRMVDPTDSRPSPSDDIGPKRETPMNSTPTPKAIETHNDLIARADEQLAHAHEQIVRADEELVGLSERLAKMERDAARPPSAIPGPQSPGPQSPPRRPALRGVVGLLLAACIIAAALVLQSSYGGEAKLVVARWVSTPSLPPSAASPGRHATDNAPLPAEPAPSIVQVAAAEAAPPPATPLVQTAQQDAAPTATVALADQAQLLQKMARDLANLEQNIEQLKAHQQQIASDNSKAIEELKASQEEIKRTLARVSEQSLSKASSPPTPPAPTVRKPERTLQSPYARARPRILRGWSYDDDW